MYGMVKLNPDNCYSWAITANGKVMLRGMLKIQAEELVEQLNSDESF